MTYNVYNYFQYNYGNNVSITYFEVFTSNSNSRTRSIQETYFFGGSRENSIKKYQVKFLGLCKKRAAAALCYCCYRFLLSSCRSTSRTHSAATVYASHLLAGAQSRRWEVVPTKMTAVDVWYPSTYYAGTSGGAFSSTQTETPVLCSHQKQRLEARSTSNYTSNYILLYVIIIYTY